MSIIRVQVVCDDFTGALSKNEVYSSAREEKTMRAALKSSTERYLNSGECVYIAFHNSLGSNTVPFDFRANSDSGLAQLHQGLPL